MDYKQPFLSSDMFLLPRPDLSRIGRQSAGNQRKDRIQPSIDLLYNTNYSVFYFNFSSPEFQRNVGKDK